MSAHLLTQFCMLLTDWEVPVTLAPFSDAPHRSTQTLRDRLPHHRPPASPRSTPVMGETQEVERAWLVGPVAASTGRLAGRAAKGNQPSLVGVQRQAVFTKA